MTDETQGAAEAAPEDTTLASDVTGDVAEASGEQPGDDAAAAPEPAKARKSAQERIDELTRKAREAERDADYWRSKAIAPPQAQAAPVEGAPDPQSYDEGVYDPRYIDDLTSWKAEQAVQKHMAKSSADREADERTKAWDARIAEGSAKFDDFQDVVVRGAQRGAWDCTQAMAEAIVTSDQGSELAYHLAKNPAEARRIAALNPFAQAREIGKLEGSLQAKPAKTMTDAPEPAPQVRGAGGRFGPSPDTQDFAAFERLADGKG